MIRQRRKQATSREGPSGSPASSPSTGHVARHQCSARDEHPETAMSVSVPSAKCTAAQYCQAASKHSKTDTVASQSGSSPGVLPSRSGRRELQPQTGSLGSGRPACRRGKKQESGWRDAGVQAAQRLAPETEAAEQHPAKLLAAPTKPPAPTKPAPTKPAPTESTPTKPAPTCSVSGTTIMVGLGARRDASQKEWRRLPAVQS
jgi:hypothetical protein